jgi:hypothetical protein
MPPFYRLRRTNDFKLYLTHGFPKEDERGTDGDSEEPAEEWSERYDEENGD